MNPFLYPSLHLHIQKKNATPFNALSTPLGNVKDPENVFTKDIFLRIGSI